MLRDLKEVTDRGTDEATAKFAPPLDDRWRDIQSRLSKQQTDQLVVRIFCNQYQRLVEGQAGFIREAEIQPIDTIPHLKDLPDELEEAGKEAVSKTVILKLNGGLGTSMGLDGPKSLLRVRDQMTFLDFIVAQAQYYDIPLLLMNSFATAAETARALESRGTLNPDRLITFLQHRVPKIRADNYAAVQSDTDPDLAWCPPGHGDLYAALLTTGTLPQLLQRNYRFMFVSNADNLGATLDLRLLGYLARNQISFLMEVADRTSVDRKGGHLARRHDGTLVLRESAQCHPDERETFQDISRHRYFNTNNLWIDLQMLGEALERCDGALPLPLIVNRKTLDPRDPSSPEIFQLETAMGAAISLLPDARAVCVPRARFAPVKTTSDLLAVRSDAYEVDERASIQLVRERSGAPPMVELDDRFYRQIRDLENRIASCPSLRHCRSLRITGDFQIPATTVFVGDVELVNQRERSVRLEAGEITGKHVFAPSESPP
jgi:UTP--glucose-1-phosphate uridylyltransferase